MSSFSRIVAAALLGLGPSVLLAQAPSIRDSAGVRLIVGPAVAGLPVRFTLADKPDVVIGGLRADPADELNSRVSYPYALQLPANRILVDQQDHWDVFDATGKRVVSLGRSGAGPGEFRITQNGCRFRGDSLLLWDSGNRRISIWGPTGKLAREYTPSGFAYGSSCLADGSILVQGATAPTSTRDAPMAAYLVVSTRGTVLATTGPLPTEFYSGSVWREMQVRGYGDHFYFGDEVGLGMRVIDEAGKITTVFRTEDVPLRVTDANLANHSMGCALNRATGKCIPYPTRAKTWPAFSAMAIDDSGRSWFRLSGVHSDSIWVGFDANGRVLGKVLVPAEGNADARRIIQFGNGDVLLGDDDPDGARRVSIYRIVPVGQR